MNASTATRALSGSAVGRAGLRDALRSEWPKVRTLRSLVWTLVVMGLFTPALAIFVGATKSLQPDDTILGGSLTGAQTALMAAAAFGVLVMSGEYGSGTIRSTFTACPRRHTVLLAKVVVVATATFVIALAGCALAYAIGKPFLTGGGYASGEPMPALFGVALGFSVLGVMGVAMGAMMRHSAGAITSTIGIILVPSMIGSLFGDWERWIAGASPMVALQKMTQSSDAASDIAGSLGAWPSYGS